MRNELCKKGLIVVIILLFIGLSNITCISANNTSDITSVTSIQIVINNDGSGDPTDKIVDIPAYIPASGITPTLAINFTIVGSYNGTTAFYGDDSWEDWKNITINGDILYPVDATTLYHVGTKGDWNCFITPKKTVYGVIMIEIEWDGYGSEIEVIQIINGTFVTPAVDLFPVGEDFNLTVTVTDMDGAAVKYAEVYLIWGDLPTPDEFNSTVGHGTVGNGLNGQYKFWIQPNSKDPTTPANAPQNITIVARGLDSFWGYAKVTMKQNNPPNKPNTPVGQSNGKVGKEYTYSSSAVDPDNDMVYLWFDWGDGNTSGWLGPYYSGTIHETSHTWNAKGTYSVKVKAIDTKGVESPWSDPLPITMPYSYNPMLQFLERLFERFPNAFPLL